MDLTELVGNLTQETLLTVLGFALAIIGSLITYIFMTSTIDKPVEVTLLGRPSKLPGPSSNRVRVAAIVLGILFALLGCVRLGWAFVLRETKSPYLGMPLAATLPPCEEDESAGMVAQAWEALSTDNLDLVLACARKTIEGFKPEADRQQEKRREGNSCHIAPDAEDPAARALYWHDYWALEHVASSYYIIGEVHEKREEWGQALGAYSIVFEHYNCAYVFDSERGYFWNAAKRARERHSTIYPRYLPAH